MNKLFKGLTLKPSRIKVHLCLEHFKKLKTLNVTFEKFDCHLTTRELFKCDATKCQTLYKHIIKTEPTEIMIGKQPKLGGK